MLCAMVVTFLVYSNFCSFFNSSMNLQRGAGDGTVCHKVVNLVQPINAETKFSKLLHYVPIASSVL